MGQTSEGAKKAAATAKLLYGPNHHKEIGTKGGKKSHSGGFATLPEEQHKAVSRRGGKAKRGYRKQP